MKLAHNSAKNLRLNKSIQYQNYIKTFFSFQEERDILAGILECSHVNLRKKPQYNKQLAKWAKKFSACGRYFRAKLLIRVIFDPVLTVFLFRYTYR